MSGPDTQYRSAQGYLDALEHAAVEEPWKAAYSEAERCHFFELALGSALHLYSSLREMNRSWREAVYRAAEPPNADRDGFLREYYRRWLNLADTLLKPLSDFERLGYQLEPAIEFRSCREAAESALAAWAPPLPARSPAMHVWNVTEEEADELRALRDAPSGAAGKRKIEPMELPEGDASILS